MVTEELDAYVEGFPRVAFDDDLRDRIGASMLGQLLRDAVPALTFTDWRFLDIAEGRAVSELPLNDESTNHHGTHQAALMALAADYTGGAAVLSLLRGVPALGVHPRLDDQGCALWTVAFETAFLAPSVAPLTISAEIPRAEWGPLRERYLAGRTVIHDVVVRFSTEEGPVAEGKYRYFLKQMDKLDPTDFGARPNPVSAMRSKASARLVAGLRAAEARERTPRVEDRYAEALAGPHGAFLARRFSAILPELRDMVVARTLDADAFVRARLEAGVRQLVLVGAGLDARPFRLDGAADVDVFELDLPHMLEEREHRLASLAVPVRRRHGVRFDLRHTSIAQALATSSDFQPNVPAVYVLEGISMYQSPKEIERLVADLACLLEHPESGAWIDFVKPGVVSGSDVESVDRFVAGMRHLGEPFTFGIDDPVRMFTERGLDAVRVSSSRVNASADPIFAFYDFVHVVRRGCSHDHRLPRHAG